MVSIEASKDEYSLRGVTHDDRRYLYEARKMRERVKVKNRVQEKH